MFEAMAANTSLIFPPRTLQLTQGFSVLPHYYAREKQGKKTTQDVPLKKKKPFSPLLFKKDEENSLPPACFIYKNSKTPFFPKASHLPPPPLAQLHLRDILFI